MSDRPWTPVSLRMRSVIESSRLDDSARDIAAALAAELRHRGVQAQLTAQEAALLAGDAAIRARGAASRAASQTVAPAVRHAGTTASRTARETVAPAIVRAGSDAGRRVGPLARRASDQADDAVRSFAATRAGRAATVGAVSGAVASIAMGVVMVAAKRAGAMSEVPPKEITKKGARKAAKTARKKAKRRQVAAEATRHGEDGSGALAAADPGSTTEARSEGVKASAAGAVETAARAVEHAPSAAFNVAATALHIGFGMALGAGFGLVHSQLPREWRDPLPTLGESVAFATVVWAGSYAGWVPLLGIMPAPHEDQPSRPATMVASHWLFGAILGAGLVAGLRATD